MAHGRGILVGAVLVLSGGLLTAVAGAQAQPFEPRPPHVVSVTGAGEASARPDRARLTMQVEKVDPDLKKAEGEVNRIVRAYLAEAKALGAKDDDIGTTGVSVNAEYVWPEPGHERRFTGYRVSRQIDVRIATLDKLGDFILRATTAGVTQVNPPALESSKAAELERQALARAAEDARAKARVLAETLGAKLGAVQRISEASAVPQPVPFVRAMQAESRDAGTSMGLALGTIRIEANVSADFDLLPP
jgi:uncharacterized protein